MHIAVQKLLYDTWACHLAKVTHEERMFRVGANYHSLARLMKRSTNIIPLDLSTRIAELLDNDETYDAMLDIADPFIPFHLWDTERNLVYVLGYGYSRDDFPDEDCFFCMTVIDREYGQHYRVSPGESVIVVRGPQYIETNPTCVSCDKEKRLE